MVLEVSATAIEAKPATIARSEENGIQECNFKP